MSDPPIPCYPSFGKLNFPDQQFSIINVSVLLAFQIELALDSSSTHPLRITAKAQIQAGLSYLRDIKENWHSAEWTLRVYEWVVKRAGLSISDGNEYNSMGQGTSFNTNHLSPRQDGDAAANYDQSIWIDPGSRPVEMIERLPDDWMQAFLEESLVRGFDDSFFNF